STAPKLQLVTILNITIFIVVISTLFLVPIETKKDPSLLSVQTAELGDNVTLHCAALQKGICNVYWYKQSLGFVPQTVASKVNDSVTVYPRFNSSFTVDKGFLAFNLKIRSITKDDEAIYFCQEGLSDSWSGTFVSVKDPNAQRFVSQTVVQQPVSASAQLGDPVALQCSITSQRTDHSNQCQGEPSVYWFRSGPSHPAAIYMNGNRSGECQNSSGRPSAPQSCVYTLPKNNVDSSDAGTYYCALAACGEVVFGNGTKLDITDTEGSKSLLVIIETYPHLVTVVLGILLACCLVGNIVQFITRNKKQVWEHGKGRVILY
uniref:Ig-like domain-containing protein n=1 Tax=Gadus morhua TaxID=8049 RepID=A0A8C5BMV3_GADMO